MTISSLHSRSSAMMLSTMQRPDPSKIANELFTKLDTTGKGYIEQRDIEKALNTLPANASTSKTEADALFTKMDSNGNGKLTKEEMLAAVQKIAAELDGQSPRMRLQGDAKPPPPPNGGGSVNAAASSSTKQSNDPADTNGDGTVSTAESLAYDIAHSIALARAEPDSTANSAGNSSSLHSSASQTAQLSAEKSDGTVASVEAMGSEDSAQLSGSAEAQFMKRMMQLLQAYSTPNQTTDDNHFSTTA
ncbi:MAG: EF-hand domain-containing protein [Methylococcaceae bacterium]|nr:MAG: EF-hand domain-containing protein [Methylococcaceae bacterium]